jgi:hypothetical protein
VGEPKDNPVPDTTPPKGGLPDVSTHTLNDPPGTVYQGPGGLTFYFDGFALKPLSTGSTSDKYINLGNGNLFDTTTGQTVQTGLGAAAGAGLASASISANASTANEQTRAQNAMDIAKLQADVQNARNANDKQAATDALNAKYAEMSGVMPNGSPTLAAQGQQFNQFKTLSDIASNPRNFMQTFFLHRGQNPPADSGGYGNGPSGLGSQYAMPSFMRGQGATGGPTAAVASPKPFVGHGQAVDVPNSTTSNTAVAQPPWAQNLPTEQSGALGGPVGYGAGMFPTGAHLGQGDNGVPVSLSDWAVKNLTGPAPTGPGQLPGSGGPGNFPPTTTTPMAHGGVTPEPIMGVGMHSNPAMFQAMQQSPGHKYLIGENGPEGVVPANMLPKFLQSRQGQEAVSAPQGASGGDATAMFGMGGPLGLPTRPMQAAMRSPLAGSTMDGGAAGMGSDITAFADGGMLGGSPTTADTAMIGGVNTWAGGPYSGMAVDKTPANAGDLTPYLSNPSAPDPTGRVQPAPTYSLAAPSSGNPAATAPPVSQTAAPATDATAAPQASVGNPYTHTHTYSGNVSPYDQLSQAGAIPPWLSRVGGQAQGDQSVGTNTAQMAYLPPGVPLVSQLAYDQMDPSEQQALLSYVSSYGVDPADYIGQVHGQMSAARRRQSIHYAGQ